MKRHLVTCMCSLIALTLTVSAQAPLDSARGRPLDSARGRLSARATGDQHRQYVFTPTGQQMPYRVYVPKTWDGKASLPIILMLHGAGANEGTYLDQADGLLMKLAEQHGYIVVSPLGFTPLGAYGNPLRLPAVFGQTVAAASQRAAVTPPRQRELNLSELEVMTALEIVTEEYGADRSRTYLAGHSMGSGGAWHLAARYPERWRAVAPMSGPFVDEATYPFERIKRLPIFMTEGTGATPSLEGSRVLARYMRERGFAFEYLEVDGNHGSMVPMVWPRIFEFFNRQGRVVGTYAAPSDSPVRGLYNWIHSTGDAERSFAFYRDVFGIELARSPFAGVASANARPEPIRPVSQAGSDPLVWDLTNTHGSRFRTVFMRAANTPFGLELSEFFDVPRSERHANPWDPGASKLIFTVRDLDAVVARLAARRTPVVTAGGVALNTPNGRAILVRDPDGYLVEVRQASSAAVAAAKEPGDVIETAIWLSVARREPALAFYERLLGLRTRGTSTANDAELRLNGVTNGTLTQTVMSIPGIEATVILAEFTRPATANPAAMPFDWRVQDVGAPQFQLEVAGLDALLERTARAGYRFLSVGGKPIQRPFGRFVFAIDPDGILVEFVEPSARAQ